MAPERDGLGTYLDKHLIGVFVVIQQDRDLGIVARSLVPEFTKLTLDRLHIDSR
jgi:hypothetical protein